MRIPRRSLPPIRGQVPFLHLQYPSHSISRKHKQGQLLHVTRKVTLKFFFRADLRFAEWTTGVKFLPPFTDFCPKGCIFSVEPCLFMS